MLIESADSNTAFPAVVDAATLAAQPAYGGPGGMADFLLASARQVRQEEESVATVDELAGLDGRPIIREGRNFYPCSPKIGQIDNMVAMLEQMRADGVKQGAAVIGLATFYLRVEDGQVPGGRRLATKEEIGDAFDLDDLGLLRFLAQKYLRISVRSEDSTARPKS